jgi:hypothetical protein
MTTAAFEVVGSIPERIAELELLIANAKRTAESDEALYNALCRACCVLIASHLEGFLKELTRGFLSDLNYHKQGFHSMPAAMKRAFTSKIAFYEGVPSADIEKRISQLIAFFDIQSVKIDMEAFSYKESPKKNPNASFIDGLFDKFGLNNIVGSLDIPSLNVVFGNDRGANYMLRRDLRRFRSKLYRYPYADLDVTYTFAKVAKKANVETLWHSFIGEVMARRHSIAHGDTTGNDTTWETLASDVGKLHVLMHALAYSAAAFLAKP